MEEANDYEPSHKIWKRFMERMGLIRMRQADKQERNEMEMAMNRLAEGQHEMVKQIVMAYKGNENRTAKVVKTAKVPAWTKQMSLETYLRTLEVWI